jgi:hypothetical protein
MKSAVYKNITKQVLRFSIDGADYHIKPGDTAVLPDGPNHVATLLEWGFIEVVPPTAEELETVEAEQKQAEIDKAAEAKKAKKAEPVAVATAGSNDNETKTT